MHITQVELENFKSYEQACVTFAPGTNAICGANGAGKSTLLEAIGFAVFGHASYTQSQFVREGQNTASVTVHLQADDERSYHIVRKCGSYSQHYVYDPELDEKLVDGVGDSTRWLREFLGVEEKADIGAIFRDAVGVPQGLLTAAFLEPTSHRKETFNPLLRVDEYEDVWAKLLDPKRWLEAEIQAQKEDIAGLEAEVKQLPESLKKEEDLKEEIEAVQGEKQQAEETLDGVTERKEALEAIKERLEALDKQVKEAEAKLKTLEAKKEEAQNRVEEAEEAQTIVAETEAAHHAYQAAQEALDELEDQRQERDNLKTELGEHEKALALARKDIKALQDDLAEIAVAEEQIEQLQPEIERQEKLEADLDDAKRAADRLPEVNERGEKAQAQLDKMESDLEELKEGLKARNALGEKISTLKSDLEALVEDHAELTAKLAGHQARKDQLQAQTQALEDAEAAQCPVCEEPLTPEHREELLAHNQGQLDELQLKLDKLEDQKSALENQREQKEAAIRSLEQEREELPREAEVEDLTERIEKQQAKVEEFEEQVSALADAPAETERLETELEELGDPQREHQRALETAAERGEVEEGLTEVKEQVEGESGQVDALEEELSAFEDLEEQLDAHRAAQQEHKTDHLRYLEHTREAESLEERKEALALFKKGLEDARDELNEHIKERDQTDQEYDEDEYVTVTQAYDQCREELATLKERLRGRKEKLGELQDEIQQLKKTQEQLTEAKEEKEALDATLNLLEHFRQVLRDAGPEITRRMVEVISVEADRLYADIMQDYSNRLRWTEEYEILLTKDGRERSFSQLSGGEEMAAALAVRLALLREVTGIDVAFFDEPTANLDERRRDNLAEQILGVKGFSQLFVISHDDTFEQDTDHVVRVIKENGVSRVEA